MAVISRVAFAYPEGANRMLAREVGWRRNP